MEGKHDFRPLQSTSIARRGRGFTVLELTLTMSILGVLVALLMPAVMSARESARQTICTSHLREVGLAIHQHHDRFRRLPAAWELAGEDLQFAYGWASEILPEIEQVGLHQRLSRLIRPPQLTNLAAAEQYSLPLLLCPSDIAEPTFGLMRDPHHSTTPVSETPSFGHGQAKALLYLPATNYVGIYGTVEADDFEDYQGPDDGSFGDGSIIDTRRINFADLQRGLSQTLLVGERKMATVPSTWLGIDLRGEDAPCRVVGSAITAPNCEICDECELSSRHAGGSIFLWADGHISMIHDSIDSRLYRESARRLPWQGDR